MAALDFPNAPAVNDFYTAPNGVVYQWTGTLWKTYGTVLATPLTNAPVQVSTNVNPAANSTNIPYDDTIPQVSEGLRLLFSNFTAANPANPIDVDVDVDFGAGGAAVHAIMALFIDGGPNAVMSRIVTPNTQWFAYSRLHWRGVLAAGTHTFEIRYGSNSGGVYYNRVDSTVMGGTMQATMTITEVGQGAVGPVGPAGPAGAPGQGARAWANFSSGAVLNGSFNVTSITKVAGGQYYVNFTTPPPNVNYSAVAGSNGGPGIMTNAYPDPGNVNRAVVVSANSVTQGYQDGNPYTFAAFW